MYTNFAKFCGVKFSRIVKSLRGLLSIYIIYMCFIVDGNRRIYCNITEIEIDQSI